ncbi:MAG: tripartite tricarboxylate transporter TctB family protein [Treponemataceae bacterium]
MVRINLIVSGVFALFAFAVIAATTLIPVSADQPLTQGSATFPLILSFVILGLSLALFLTNIGQYRKQKGVPREAIFKSEQMKIVAGGFLIILLSAILMLVVGFIPAMMALNLAFLLYFKVKNKILIASVSIVTPILVYVVFQIVLSIPLPGGLLFS